MDTTISPPFSLKLGLKYAHRTMLSEVDHYGSKVSCTLFALSALLGKGGNAGRVKINYRKLNGSMTLSTCGGTGADAAKNGQGGRGMLVLFHHMANH